MNDAPDDEIKAEKKARAIETARKMWMILTPIFALIALFSFYNWTWGSSPSGLFSQLGLMLIGLSTLIGNRNKILSYILLAVAMILVIAGLVRVIMD